MLRCFFLSVSEKSSCWEDMAKLYERQTSGKLLTLPCYSPVKGCLPSLETCGV